MNRLSAVFLGMLAGWDMAGSVHCFKFSARVREGNGHGVTILTMVLMVIMVVQSPGQMPSHSHGAF